jgi:uncharacterized protein (TIGR04222 family)
MTPSGMPSPPGVPDADVYDIAFVAGGVARLVDTVLVALVESGRIRVPSPGQLAAAEPFRRHPVEAAVLDAVGTQGHRSVDTIRWRLASDERVLDVGRRLKDDGLLRRDLRGLLRRDRHAYAATAAGRRALRQFGELPDPSAGESGARMVALHGRGAMPDQALRAAIFEAPAAPTAGADRATSLRRRRDVVRGDAEHAAYNPRGSAAGGASGVGFVDGMGGGGGL